MTLLKETTHETPIPSFLVTRFARGRLFLWITLSALAASLNTELLHDLPRWVFAIWASWIAISAGLVIALEYVLLPVRRHWLDALQACVDLPVIALVTWYAGAAPFLLAPCLAIPMVSATGWLPKRPALWVAMATELTMLFVIVLIVSGWVTMPTPPSTFERDVAPHAFLVMVLGVQAGSPPSSVPPETKNDVIGGSSCSIVPCNTRLTKTARA